MSCLNMAAVCGTRVGGRERGGEERRRDVWFAVERGWCGGVIPSKLVSEVFVGESCGAATRRELLPFSFRTTKRLR
jgi:hypothetical protein